MEITTTQNTGALSTGEFHLTGEYLALTERQRVWVDSFIEFQSIERATTEAYGADHTDSYSRMLSAKNETNRRIVAALNVFYKRSDREKLLLELERAIVRATGIAKIHAMTLYARLKFGVEMSQPSADRDTEEEPKRLVSQIGDIVLVDGVKHRVSAVDKNGYAADGDAI